MKREYHHTNPGNFSSTGSCSSSDKAALWSGDDGVDELFAVLGYNVKCSDMADVAHKIQQLEQAMESAQPEGLSQLASDTVHYNPSDLSSWLESMISGIEDPFLDSSTITSASAPPPVDLDDFGSDLISIPGEAIYPHPKRLKTEESPPAPGLPALAEPARPVVLVDSQENGIRLVHSLMACADAVQQGNLKMAKALVKNIEILAVSQAGAMGKVATYFAKALESRIYRLHLANPQDSAFTDSLQMHFYEACPYLKFAHFTANQAILEAFAGKYRVHVIDFSTKQGMQWPVLLQALARRPEGPPTFRLTAVGRDGDNLPEVLRNLAQFAKNINVRFECGRLAAKSLADLKPSAFDVREGETVAVNSIFELHRSLARPGSVDKVLQVVRDLKPAIVTVAEQEANHNGSVFLDRFTESLHYYSTLFDSLESAGGGDAAVSVQDKVMSEVYLGLQICNVVACEGVDRVERHETLGQWRTRFGSAGFEPVHLGSNAFKEASMLLEWFAGGDGYRVEENSGCLMLGWHTRPLIATSAWKLA